MIDVCLTHGIWLDSGEVVAVADHAALRARVGVNAAQQASEASDWRGYHANRWAIEAEASMRTATASTGNKKRATCAGFFLLLSAASAATELGKP